MKMIRIAKMPYIQEDTDRWGRPLGTFSVVDVQGDIDEDKWNRIQEYEGYFLSEGAKEDEATMKAHIYKAIVTGNVNQADFPKLPHMRKVIDYAKSLIWQFNLLTQESGDESKYIRSYAIFNEKTLHEWTPEHDEKVKYLKEQAAVMSKETKKEPV